MVCPTAILSSSLALSLLRHSSPPNQSFVFSPFSLNTALSIVHDGAVGTTQEELTNLLLKGCTPSNVTSLYSDLALNLPSNKETVTFKSANRFYISDKISLKDDYKKHVDEKYNVKVKNIDFRQKDEAAKEMNNFVEEATNGKIKNVIDANEISEQAEAYLVNALFMQGWWKTPFERTYQGYFYGVDGERKMDFMRVDATYRMNLENDMGTVVVIPYKDENYNFFFLMPNKNSSLEEARDELTGEKLLSLLRTAEDTWADVRVPKFKVSSKIEDGVELLKGLGVNRLFESDANLSKISSTPLRVSKIKHSAVIELHEKGTVAAAFTAVKLLVGFMEKPIINIDRPFLFGIVKNENIVFLGQYV